MSVFIKIGKLLLSLICVCLASLIPKNKSIWVFGAWFGKSFSDNPKYMYKYLASLSSDEIKPIWISKDIELVLELQKQGINAYYYSSFAGIYYQLVSKVVLVSHSISADLNPWFVGFTTKRVQLWHGIPLKKIGFDDHLSTSKQVFIQKYPALFSLLKNNRYDLVISTGNVCSKLFSSAFNVPINKIVTTGFPRNDVFLTNQNKYKKKSAFKVIYMPTLRGDIDDEFDLFNMFGFDIKEIDAIFDMKNIELDIRTHPANRPSDGLIANLEHCSHVKISTVKDIYEEINNYDCLITDYSSIMFDFVISKKPILFAPFDLDNYLISNRQLYYPYSDISNGKVYKNWPELIDAILDLENKKNQDVGSNDFLLSFHNDIDLKENGFSISVFNELKTLIK